MSLVSMSTEDMYKQFKRKLISGIPLFGIGIALIILGSLIFEVSGSSLRPETKAGVKKE